MSPSGIPDIKEIQKQLNKLEQIMQQLVRRVDHLDKERRRIKQEIGNVKNK